MSDDRQNTRLERFRELASERMERLSLLWMDLEQGSKTALPELLRALHTHKGDASITGFAKVAALTHALEDAVGAMTVSAKISSEDGDLYFEAVDTLSEILALLPDDESDAADSIIQKLEARVATSKTGDGESAPALGLELAPYQGSELKEKGATKEEKPKRSLMPERKPAPPKKVAKEPDAATSLADNSLRVQAVQLDRMREIMGELLLARGRLDLSATRVRKERESAERDRGSVDASQLARRLEGTLGSLESGLRDDVVHLSNLIGALDDLTTDLRMVPVKELFDRYPRHIRDLSRDLGKQVWVSISGQEARLDREILNALEEPLLHLVRNAIDHGIEKPQVRMTAGKEETGTISLSTQLQGNSLRITVSDDGGGIDVDDVRVKARAKGLLAEDNDDEGAALQCLLAPGMTTRTTLSELSGRGIGLDVVDSTVRSLEGSVEIQSKLNQGTSFILTVPLSAVVSEVVTFRVGRGTYALPASVIESIEREIDQVKVDTIAGQAIRYRNMSVPVIALDERLGETDRSYQALHTRLVIVRDRQQLFALSGAFEHAQREAVLKPAAGLLRHEDLVTAGCPLDNGEIALMLNLSRVVQGSTTRQAQTTRQVQRTALLADDSPIIRDLLSETLRSFGLHVIEAEDGADALLQLEKHGNVDILVTDLDMPNIGGIELLRAVRRRPGPRMPAIVVSTRGSEADQIAAIDAGADAYLVKTAFTPDGLWSLVSKFLSL